MLEGGRAEAEHLLRELEGDDYGFDKLRERAWICNILARRYRYDGRLDDAVAAAQEAIDIGRNLGDPYLVALNRVALGNALDQKDDLSGALECFKESSREARAIKRPEMETLASRRAADVLVQMADKAAPLYRAKLYGEAESFATYALGLARGSIAEHDAGIALETRADARGGLERKAEADADYAAAARIFSPTHEDDAARIIRHMVANIDLNRPKETIESLMAAIVDPAQPRPKDLWELLVALLRQVLLQAPRKSVGALVGAVIRIAQSPVSATQEVGLWIRLLSLALKGGALPDDGRGTFALSAFLAHTRRRDLSATQMAAIADLTLSGSDHIRFNAVGGHLQISLNIGRDDKVLFILDDLDATPATRFVALSLASFFLGYRRGLERDFLSSPMDDGVCVRISLLDIAEAPEDIRGKLQEQTTDGSPVALAYFADNSGKASNLMIACRPDAQERCKGDPLRATELQFMYADALSAVLRVTLGGRVDDEILRPKLAALLRSTIQ
jgi:tetratricopeptide (TPR) repeat protein